MAIDPNKAKGFVTKPIGQVNSGRIRGTISTAAGSVKAPHMGKILPANKLPAQPAIPNPDSKTSKRRFFVGKKQGKLTLLERRHDKLHKSPNKRKQWLVKCECNPKKKFWVPEYYLKRKPNPKMDCGCSRRSNKMTHNKEYRIWYMMNTRTTNPDHVAYKHYGGRGIRVCQRWQWGPKGGILDDKGNQIKDGFSCFLEDMGPRPSPEMTIDRIDNDKGYQPDNVKWATPKEQAQNRRSKEEIARDLAKFRRSQKQQKLQQTEQDRIDNDAIDDGWSKEFFESDSSSTGGTDDDE